MPSVISVALRILLTTLSPSRNHQPKCLLPDQTESPPWGRNTVLGVFASEVPGMVPTTQSAYYECRLSGQGLSFGVLKGYLITKEGRRECGPLRLYGAPGEKCGMTNGSLGCHWL